MRASASSLSRQHCLYLRPEPQRQGSLRPSRTTAVLFILIVPLSAETASMIPRIPPLRRPGGNLGHGAILDGKSVRSWTGSRCEVDGRAVRGGREVGAKWTGGRCEADGTTVRGRREVGAVDCARDDPHRGRNGSVPKLRRRTGKQVLR